MKIKNKLKDRKGITVIALVITIIVLLILAGVSIASLTGPNGLLTKANEAKEETAKAGAIEKVQKEVVSSYDNNGNLNMDRLKENLKNNLGLTDGDIKDNGDGSITVTVDGYEVTVDSDGNVTIDGESKPPETSEYTAEEIFDETGEEEGKLHVGDFINYDAGTWNQEDFNTIKTGPKDSLLPITVNTSLRSYQFGGIGTTRNDNAAPYRETYNYLHDSNGNEVAGWRLFDVVDGKMILISAGNTENYTYQVADENSAYISQYIATGQINNAANSLDLPNNYEKRTWNEYKNNNPLVLSATTITKTDLDEWYGKYVDKESSNIDVSSVTTFRKVETTKYKTLILNNSFYTIFESATSKNLYYHDPSGRHIVKILSPYTLGVRVLITLSPSAKLLGEIQETKEIDNYTHNVWQLKAIN